MLFNMFRIEKKEDARMVVDGPCTCSNVTIFLECRDCEQTIQLIKSKLFLILFQEFRDLNFPDFTNLQDLYTYFRLVAFISYIRSPIHLQLAVANTNKGPYTIFFTRPKTHRNFKFHFWATTERFLRLNFRYLFKKNFTLSLNWKIIRYRGKCSSFTQNLRLSSCKVFLYFEDIRYIVVS